MFIPIKEYIKQNTATPLWLTKELKHLIKEKKTAWFKYQNSSSKNIELLENYKIFNSIVKKRVKKAVMAFERELALDAKKNPKRINAYINSKTKIKDTIRALKDTNDIIITGGPQIANILNNYFASVFCEEDLNNIPSCEYISKVKCSDPTFDETIVMSKLKKLNTSKSIGIDKVHPRVLKECSESISKPLSIIFNCSYSTGSLPKQWLNANVTPLSKKGDKLNPSNYRPVSLTSIVCKVMENIIRDALVQHYLVNGLITSAIHGFMAKKSCITRN
jgi:hypothetical protein